MTSMRKKLHIQKTKAKLRRKFNEENVRHFQYLTEQAVWSAMYTLKNASSMYDQFHNTVITLFDKACPLIEVHPIKLT